MRPQSTDKLVSYSLQQRVRRPLEIVTLCQRIRRRKRCSQFGTPGPTAIRKRPGHNLARLNTIDVLEKQFRVILASRIDDVEDVGLDGWGVPTRTRHHRPVKPQGPTRHAGQGMAQTGGFTHATAGVPAWGQHGRLGSRWRSKSATAWIDWQHHRLARPAGASLAVV